MVEKYNFLDRIIKFEEEGMEEEELVEFFTDLRDTGMLWNLQGMYQRTYFRLVEAGLIKESDDAGKE